MRLIDGDALLERERVRHDMFLDCEYIGDKARRDELGIIMADIVNAPTVGGWISVKDRLPEKKGQYLCWFGKNTVFIGAAIVTYLEMWKAFGSLVSLETYPNVTHWMPLPEPPEEVSGDG